MEIRSIRLLNFRAHSASSAEFAPGINLIVGPNGAGKTNVLEALHYLCLTKSFVTSTDRYVLRKGCPHFEIEGLFEGSSGRQRRIRLTFSKTEGKRVLVDGAPLDRLSDVVGTVPVVTYSPEDHALTAGGPEERRRFLNNIMSQERPVYMDDLLKYRRTLRQRNEVLSRLPRGAFAQAHEPVLQSWTAEYIKLAARVTRARAAFVSTFSDYLAAAYDLIGESVEHPRVRYSGFGQVEELDESEVAGLLKRRLDAVESKEHERGRTMLGPHRDDLVFLLNDFEVRRYASQGQHRTFGMALKLAQYLYLQEKLEERPLMLLDDVFGSLDPERTRMVMRILEAEDIGQSFITATHAEPFAACVSFDGGPHKAITVARRPEEPARLDS